MTFQKGHKLSKGVNNAMYGKPVSEETRKRISLANKGKKRSEETKKKISEALKGKPSGMLGKHLSKELKIKLSQIKLSNKNPMWKGDKVGYNALHDWIKERLKKPQKCPKCYKRGRIDLANISQKYKRDLSDWEWLCRRCHMKKDGRLKNLIKRNKLSSKLWSGE